MGFKRAKYIPIGWPLFCDSTGRRSCGLTRRIERCYETSEIHNHIVCDRAYLGTRRSLGRIYPVNPVADTDLERTELAFDDTGSVSGTWDEDEPRLMLYLTTANTHNVCG